MADTTPTTIDTSILEAWARRSLRELAYGGFFARFRGGPGSAIVLQTELLNRPGDLIHIQVTDPLSESSGVTGDEATLTDNEQAITTTEIKCSPLLYRNAVRLNRRAVKKSTLNLNEEASFRLTEWAMAKMDVERFDLFTETALPSPLNGETYTPNLYIVGGGADIDDVQSGDDLTVEEVQKIRLTLETNKAKPLIIDGDPVYVLVTHPNALLRLKRESEYREWVREADIRGKDNAFFRGATAMLDGVVLFSNFRVPKEDNAGTVATPVAKSLAFGAEAFVEALDEETHFSQDVFDYGLKQGLGYEFAFQPRRALELSSLQVLCEAPNIADI